MKLRARQMTAVPSYIYRHRPRPCAFGRLLCLLINLINLADDFLCAFHSRKKGLYGLVRNPGTVLHRRVQGQDIGLEYNSLNGLDNLSNL